MASDWKSKDRDASQRSLGCVSLSILAHAGLVGALLFAPQEKREIMDAAGKGGQTVFVDNQEPGDQAPTEAAAVAETPPTPAVAAVPEPEAPVAEVKTPKVAAVMARPRTHGFPDKKKPTPKQRALPTLPPEEQKKLETVADADQSYQPSEVPDVPVVATQSSDEGTPQSASVSAPTDAAEVAEAKAEENAEEAAKENATPVGAVSEPEAPGQLETAAPVAVQTPASAPKATAPSNSNGIGEGPANGPRGAGTGYGAPVGGGEALVTAEMRNPLPGNPIPVYPVPDRLSGRQGTTTLSAQVSAEGTVSDVVVAGKSGSDAMDRASVEALKKWKFAKGSAVRIGKTFAFRLTNQPEIARAQLGH